MAVVNGPAPFPKISPGKPTKIGSIATVTDILQFSLSENSGYHLGSIVFQAIPNGTVTTFTVNINVSLDGGTTFNTQTGNVGAATIASNTSGLNFQTGPLQNVAMPGIGGQCSLQFAAATLTLGTATKIDIWALVA